MAYFSPSIDADGIHVPTYADIMDYLIEQYKVVFGDDVYVGEETKDYQMLSIFAKCLSDFGSLCVDDYNARNPNYATGNSLDLLLPLVSMTRRGATCSTVTLKVSGTAGVVIPAGSQAIDTSGNLWALDEAVEIASGGSNVPATCVTAGAIAAPIGTISSPYSVVEGWEEVTNEVAATLGLEVETDEEVRIRRKQVLNLWNNGTYDALVRALLNVSGVEFADVRMNDSSSTDDLGIPAHSVCCVVKGGENADVAEAIWKTKAPGIGTHGTTTVSYVDDYGHSNSVKFIRPANLTVNVVVTINALSGYDSSRCSETIKGVLKGAINSLGVGKAWGVTMAYRDIYNAFSGEECPFVIASVTGKTSDMQTASSVEVPCAFNKILVTEDANISIVVNE